MNRPARLVLTFIVAQTPGEIKTKKDFLPLDRPAVIGVTSGASTPDAYVQESLEQLFLLKGLSKA